MATSITFPLPRNFGEVLLDTEKNFEIPIDIAMVVEAKGGTKLVRTSCGWFEQLLTVLIVIDSHHVS